MTIRALLLLLTLALPAPLAAQVDVVTQPAIIESAEVLGLPRGQLSADLARDIDALAGTALDRDRLSALIARIESEVPGTTAAVRDVMQPDGRVRITLVVMRVSVDGDEPDNVNRRYIVSRARVRGVDNERLSQDLRDALQALVGRPLEEGEADALAKQIEAELVDFDVHHRISRGDDTGEVRVDFVVMPAERSRWVPFAPTMSKLVYHRRQGWSGAFDIPFGLKRNRVTLGLAKGNNDDRVEEYSGYSLRIESRDVATRRLGLSLEFARYTPDWRASTLTALSDELAPPALYGRRTTVTPAATVALTRDLRITGGIMASELDPLVASEDLFVPPSTRATAGFTQIAFGRNVHPGIFDAPAGERKGGRTLEHSVAARYLWQGGRESLGSDLVYDLHVGSARYSVSGEDARLTVAVQAGRLSGDAPLFARFTLGDTTTLRGWDKYAFAPAGGDRMFHSSIEYGYKGFVYFVDAGDVWRAGADRRVRVSTGVGFDTGYGFIMVGVPLNADRLTGTLMFGFRGGMTFGHARLP